VTALPLILLKKAFRRWALPPSWGKARTHLGTIIRASLCLRILSRKPIILLLYHRHEFLELI
jgi:hypothetical protein